MVCPRLSALIVLCLELALVDAFSFAHSDSPSQCRDFTVEWNGGQPPFSMVLSQAFSVARRFSIPDSAWNGTSGKYTLPLPIPATKRFLVTMSDAGGFGTGGNSALLTSGAPTNQNQCNTTDPAQAFDFVLDSALQQCRAYVFEGYGNATGSVTITGLIPLGNTIVLNPPPGDTFTWMANVAAGTNIIFVLSDSQGGEGGSSDIITATESDDSSCLTGQYPSSTAQSDAIIPTSTSSSKSSSSTSPSAATIAGAVVAVILAAFLITSLVVFHMRRKRGLTNEHFRDQRFSHLEGSIDLLPTVTHQSTAPMVMTSYPPGAEPVPFVYEPSVQSPSQRPESSHHSDVFGDSMSNPAFRSARSSTAKSALGPNNIPIPRYIVHTDAGSIDDADESTSEVVELPPMYDDRRDSSHRPASSTGPPSSPNE